VPENEQNPVDKVDRLMVAIWKALGSAIGDETACKFEHAVYGAGLESPSALSKRVGINCSFCGKSSLDVATVVAGPGVNICDECASLAHDVCKENVAKRAAASTPDN